MSYLPKVIYSLLILTFVSIKQNTTISIVSIPSFAFPLFLYLSTHFLPFCIPPLLCLSYFSFPLLFLTSPIVPSPPFSIFPLLNSRHPSFSFRTAVSPPIPSLSHFFHLSLILVPCLASSPHFLIVSSFYSLHFPPSIPSLTSPTPPCLHPSHLPNKRREGKKGPSAGSGFPCVKSSVICKR